MFVSVKSHAMHLQKDTKLEEAFPISERSKNYHHLLHSTEQNNSKYQNAASGKCYCPPTAHWPEPEGTRQVVSSVGIILSEAEQNMHQGTQLRKKYLGTHSRYILLEQTLFSTQSGLKV